MTARRRPGAGPRGLALVSGGSGDIGSAICRRLHRDGWGIVIGCVSQGRARLLADELSTDETPVSTLPLDLSDAAQTRAGLEQLLAENERVDALVLNAGQSETVRFVDTQEDDWWSETDVNFLGPALVLRLVLPGMLAAGRGAVVGITSDAAKVGDQGHAPYAAAKAALMALLRSLVLECGDAGVTFNAIAPGPIDTGMLRTRFGDEEATAQALAALRRLVPSHRLGDPAHVAEAVRVLISDNDYVTGQHLSVGGGVTMQ